MAAFVLCKGDEDLEMARKKRQMRGPCITKDTQLWGNIVRVANSEKGKVIPWLSNVRSGKTNTLH